jgi:2-aminoadipate transaminase
VWLTTKLTQLKQAADLHSSTFDQRLAYRVLASGAMPAQIDGIRQLYASRCESMLQALGDSMPAGVQWNRPEGGMFIWVNLPPHYDSYRLLQQSINVNQPTRVAFVPGAPFHAVTARSDCLRLSFVTVDAERIRTGIRQLADNIRAM